MSQNILDVFIKIDPQNKDYYVKNASIFKKDLNTLDEYAKSALAQAKGKSFLVFHPAWTYFAHDYDINQIALEVGAKEASARDFVKAIKQANVKGIKTVFVSPKFGIKNARSCAKEIGGEVVVIDENEQDYILNMRKVIDLFAKNLK
jgi:zinc transport system substrate-binding protein